MFKYYYSSGNTGITAKSGINTLNTGVWNSVVYTGLLVAVVAGSSGSAGLRSVGKLGIGNKTETLKQETGITGFFRNAQWLF